MKKIMSLVLILTLIASIFAVSAVSYSAVDADPDKLYIKADGELYEVSQGDIFTYTRCLVVPDVRVSSIDASTEYDASSLEFMPDFDEYGDEDLETMFPILKYPVWSFKDGRITYNFSTVKGVLFQKENSVLFTGKFKVTADKGICEINSKIKTMGDSDLNKLIYNYAPEDGAVFGTNTAIEVKETLTEAPTQKPTEAPTAPPTEEPTKMPTEAPTAPPTEESTEKPTAAPTDKPTEAETQVATQAETQAADKIYIKADGELYPVCTGDVFRYTAYLTVPSLKISSLNASTSYPSQALELIPVIDEYGDEDLEAMFPVMKSPVANFDTDNMVLYNFSNTRGVRFNKSTSVLFTTEFKVTTAQNGIYEINTMIQTLADSDVNKLIDEYTIKPGADVTLKQVIETKPEPTAAPTEPETEPSTTPSQPTEPQVEGLYIRADGELTEVEKGQIYTYFYYLQVPGYKISSLDAYTKYDADGLNFIPDKDDQNDYDYEEMFPILPDPVCNFDEYGEIIYNISKVSGVRFSNEKSVLFKGQFEVTADNGIYDILTVISYMYDDNTTGLIVDGKIQPDVIINAGTKLYDNRSKVLLGDINDDGKVTILDATVLQRRLAKFNITPYNEKAADVDRDGKIIIADATRIQRYIAKLLKGTEINSLVFVD